MEHSGGSGKNTLDFGDIDLLDAPKNAGGLTAEQVVAHETLEAYSSSKGKGFNDAHKYANKFFGGLNDASSSSFIYDANRTNAIGVSAVYPVHGKPGVNAQVTYQFVTPVPVNSIPQIQSGSLPVHITNVEKKP